MPKNKLTYTELKQRTETPQDIPFKVSRMPAKNVCIGEYMWEFPGVTSYTDIRLAHPGRKRPYWSLWTKTYCPMAEEFIHRVESACLVRTLPAEKDDNIDTIIHYMLIQFLEVAEDYTCNWARICDRKFDDAIFYAAVLSLEDRPEEVQRFNYYLSKNRSAKMKKIIDTAFPEFRERVTERLDAILAG
jgi:hypothetical protein